MLVYFGDICSQINSFNPFHIYQKLWCYNSSTSTERNVPIAHYACLKMHLGAEHALIPLVTPQPPTANGLPTLALSALIFRSLKVMFTGPVIITWLFSLLWSHLHDITNYFPIGHLFFHYSNLGTFDYEILNGCIIEKKVHFGDIYNQISFFKSLYIYQKSECYN